MSYSRSLGDPPGGCLDQQAWKAAQLACNAGDASQCAMADAVRSLCVGPNTCEQGTLVYESVPRQNRATGQWGTVAISYCTSPVAPAAIAQSAKTNWGLFLGIGVAALIVYKVAF